MAAVSGNDIVKEARSYEGKVTYKFGSDSIENGTGDCSAFTQHVYSLFNIKIGRNTEIQWTGGGTKIEEMQLQPGDLVFFKDTYNNNNTDKVSHVGIYSGNGMFINLNNDGVTEDNLFSGYWQEHYLGAKRMDNVSGTETGGVTNTYANTKDLKWYGDVIIYVLVALAVIAGVVMLALSIGLDLNPVKKIGGI